MPKTYIKIILSFIFVVLVTGSLSIISYNLGLSNSQSLNSENSLWVETANLPNTKAPKTFQLELPRQANYLDQTLNGYQNYKLKLREIVIQENPKAALNQLQNDLKTEITVQQNCHSYTHLIGNFALEKYSFDLEKSISYNLDTCGGGYLHGIIEDYLEKYPEKRSDLYSICKNPLDGGCFHALGHGFMLKNEFDTDISVLDCDILNTAKQRQRCREGVFMENFDSANVSDSEKPFLKSTDPFYPCNKYKTPYLDDCYYYSGRYVYRLEKDPYLSLQKCLTLKNEFSALCVRGMAAGILRDNLTTPEKLEKICLSIASQLRSCLTGAVNYHIFMFDSKDKTQNEMCKKFTEFKLKKTCTELVQESKINFE